MIEKNLNRFKDEYGITERKARTILESLIATGLRDNNLPPLPQNQFQNQRIEPIPDPTPDPTPEPIPEPTPEPIQNRANFNNGPSGSDTGRIRRKY